MAKAFIGQVVLASLLVWAEKKLSPSQAKETKMERADDVRVVLKTPAQFSLFEATF